MHQISLAIVSITICSFATCRTNAAVTTEGCSSTKTCFWQPEKCELSDPTCIFVSWAPADEGDAFDFEMSGGAGGGDQYIAFAFGTQSAMTDADMYYCDGNTVRSGAIQARYTPPAYYEMNNGLSTKFAETVDGVGQCVLSRPASVMKTITSGEKTFDITMDEYYLLAAIGPMNGTAILKHDVRKTVTNYTINFSAGNQEVEDGITTEGCGDTKTCFRDPENCDISDSKCRFFSWRKGEDDKYIFEMSGGSGAGENYIAIALAKESAMQDADLYYCDGKTVRSGAIQALHVPPAYFDPPDGFQIMSASTVNGVAQCSFARPAVVTKEISNGENYAFDIEKNQYYLLGAIGPMNGTMILKHNQWKTKTSDSINFSKEPGLHEVDGMDEGCGETKTCFKDPENCDISDSGCRYFSWRKGENDKYVFEMSGGSGDGENYIAMALAKESAMQDADLYYCDGKAVRSGAIQAQHKPPAYLDLPDGFLVLYAQTVNGVAQCSFVRPAVVTKEISNGENYAFDIKKNQYYLLGAIGPMNGTMIQKHNQWKTKTNDPIDFSKEIDESVVITRDGCGSTKSCQSFPSSCTIGEADCYFYSWQKRSDDSFDFEIVGNGGSGSKYTAIALGTQSRMIDADLYYCDGIAVRSGVIRDRGKEPAYQVTEGLKSISAKSVDGVVQCVFNRPAAVTKTVSEDKEVNFDLNSESYYLLASSGPMDGTELMVHTWKSKTDERVISDSGIAFGPQPTILAFLSLLVIKTCGYMTS